MKTSYGRATVSTEQSKKVAAAESFLADLKQGRAKGTRFAYHVAFYVRDNPEEATTMATHHYQSFFENKQRYMVQEKMREIENLVQKYA